MVKKKTKTEEPKLAGRTLHYFWVSGKKYRLYAVFAVITEFARVFVNSILGPLIIADIIGKISDGLPVEQIAPTLLGEALGYLAIFAFSNFILDQLTLYLYWVYDIKVQYDLANQCFKVINDQSMQFHSDRFSGSLVSQVNRFIGAIELIWDTIIWEMVPFLTRIIMIVVVMLALAPWYAVGVIGVVLIFTLVAGLSFKKLGQLNQADSAAHTKQTGQLADSVTNIITVKSYAREKHEQRRYAFFSHECFNTSKTYLHAVLVRDFCFSFAEVAMMAIVVVFLIYGPSWFNIPIATLVLVVNYSHTILGNLNDVNGIFKHFNRAFGDAYEMVVVLDMVDDVVDAPNAKKLQLEKSDVHFDKIGFKHKDAKTPIFQDFNLHVQPGERVGLVGVSGSGKTTLTKLLLRFADVDEGRITISDQDIRDVTQNSLREAIAYVPQETSLFHRSIADNIAYGKLNATKTEIERAAKLANAHEFIKDLPQGYDTLVGERGVKLSGGQRQRVAIARAILKDAPILVLDEATSALDSESEALIQDALNTLMKGRTSVVIAHRLSTVANLDRIVVLENGKIVEQGTHQELLAKPHGVYHHLWDRQSGAFMEEK